MYTARMPFAPRRTAFSITSRLNPSQSEAWPPACEVLVNRAELSCVPPGLREVEAPSAMEAEMKAAWDCDMENCWAEEIEGEEEEG